MKKYAGKEENKERNGEATSRKIKINKNDMQRKEEKM